MTHWFSTAILLSVATVGCAQTPPVQYAYRATDARAETFAIEAAKQHPNAQPRVRPAYPEQAPPPLPQGSSLPPPAYITRRAQPLQLSAPTFDDTLAEPAGYASYNDYAPGYAYPSYYGPAYPSYGYGLGYGLGWRSSYGYGWGPRYVHHYDSWSSPRYRDFDRPHYHGHSTGHLHGDSRPSLGVPHLSAPSHGSFSFSSHAGDRGSRPARTNIRLRR